MIAEVIFGHLHPGLHADTIIRQAPTLNLHKLDDGAKVGDRFPSFALGIFSPMKNDYRNGSQSIAKSPSFF